MTVDAFRALLSNTDLFVYEHSVDENDGTVAALVRRDLEKLLAVAGKKAETFTGTEEKGLKLCPLTNENARALMQPQSEPRPESPVPCARAGRFCWGRRQFRICSICEVTLSSSRPVASNVKIIKIIAIFAGYYERTYTQ